MGRIPPIISSHFSYSDQRQHNPCFLLTSKSEIKFPRFFSLTTYFPHSPWFYLLSFVQLLTCVLYLFIHLSIYIPPSSSIRNQVWIYLVHTTKHVKILHTYISFPCHISNIFFKRTHGCKVFVFNQNNGLASHQHPRFLDPILGGPSQNAGLASDLYPKILIPFQGDVHNTSGLHNFSDPFPDHIVIRPVPFT